jgi:hypothetical protein
VNIGGSSSTGKKTNAKVKSPRCKANTWGTRLADRKRALYEFVVIVGKP